MSINWEKSAELNDMSVSELIMYFKQYPGSNKKIVAICEGNCGSPDRIVSYRGYHDLCLSCANKKRYEDPEERRKPE